MRSAAGQRVAVSDPSERSSCDPRLADGCSFFVFVTVLAVFAGEDALHDETIRDAHPIHGVLLRTYLTHITPFLWKQDHSPPPMGAFPDWGLHQRDRVCRSRTVHA